VLQQRDGQTLGVAAALETLASTTNTFAARSAAALVGALAAAVTTKVARTSLSGADAAQAEQLRSRLVRLAEVDAHVFGTARAAVRGVGGTGDQVADVRLGEALSRAAAVPLEIAEACADVAVIAGGLARTVDLSLEPDVSAASLLAAAAAGAAAVLVEANLAVAPEDDRAARARAAAQAASAACD